MLSWQPTNQERQGTNMTQPLSDIVSVDVQVSPLSTVNSGFSVGLIVGTSTHVSATDRVLVYAGPEDMIANGWDGTEPEYLAAQVYFGQVPRPRKVAIGRWDDSGTETAVQAVTLCRLANKDWYSVYVCDVTKIEILAISAFIESAMPLSSYFYDTEDLDVLAGAEGNVMDVLIKAKRHRTWGQFSTFSYAAAAAMGYAMGANTGLTNSAYTLAYKTQRGVSPEEVTTSQFNTILAQNGNIYTNFGATYDLLVYGTMADGVHFDEVLNLDVLTNEIQRSVMDALVTAPKIPQIEDGIGVLISAITAPCALARDRGVIAPGVWKSAPILGLKTGDTLSTGYMILADSIANQTQADRDARISPPIYVAVKLAGAIEHVIIGVVVNR